MDIGAFLAERSHRLALAAFHRLVGIKKRTKENAAPPSTSMISN